MNRFTHSERAERRKQISAEAHDLINTMSYDSTIKFLVTKYNLTDAYIKQILPSKLKSKCKAQMEEQILKDLLSMSGTAKPSAIYKAVADKYDLCVSFVAGVCRKYKVRLPVPDSKLRNNDKEEQIRYLIEQGVPVSEIAKRLNNTRENIYRYYRRMLREGSITTIPMTRFQSARKNIREKIQSNSQEIIELYNSGMSVQNISAKLEIPMTSLSSFISDNSIITVTRAPAIPESRRKWLLVIADLFDPNLSLSDIARKHGKPASNVCLFAAECKKLGIPLPQRVDGRTKRFTAQQSSEVPSITALNVSEDISVESSIGHTEKFVDSTSTVIIRTV